ncbi:lipoyl synthase [Deferrisoma camini]|uniref:lipoyl synthase n=1 Tax=Deferrisoma camini TaxID=1035120 RepID=UPI00046CB442|nr:lipoyl synthase [Deferrisoma camini]
MSVTPTPSLPRIRVRPSGLRRTRRVFEDLGIPTVCEGALCPNRPECYDAGHVTVLILGRRCTRACGFCAVDHGGPEPVDPNEPARVAELAARLGMRHVVVTSVTRDDLPDGGAGQYAAVARAVAALPGPVTAEALVPDFQGDPEALAVVAAAPYRVLAHNVETVPRLYPRIRPGADYARSLGVLRTFAGLADRGQTVKSGLMLGLGESADEVRRVLADLRGAGVDAVCLGQYLRPGPGRVPVSRYLQEAEFERWAEEARALGFAEVWSGPRVRSSYRVSSRGRPGAPETQPRRSK